MISQLLTIARNTFLEAVRQPIYFIMVLICGVAQILTTWGTGFSLGYSDSSEVSGDNKLLLDLSLATVFVCGTLLAAFIATAVMSREIENKTVLTVVSKPVARPVLVLGKYLGVAAAMLIAVAIMLIFVQLAVRHEVLATASDVVDQPVLLFGLLAVGLAFLVGVWGNFFYGWVFSQTTTLLMLPLFALAWLMVLLIDKDWQWQALSADFKPQIAIASYCLLLALLVLTAAATAASTRLGQVMTIVVCAGVFLFGMLSNHFIGRRVYANRYQGIVRAAAPAREVEAGLDHPGDTYTVHLKFDPRTTIEPGMPFYYGPSPTGFPLSVEPFTPFRGDPADRDQLFAPATPRALVITAASGRELTVRRAGGAQGKIIHAPPAPGDYIFITPTRVSRGALLAWGVVPNVQLFWLIDAVSQNQPIPPRHVGLVSLYAGTQVGALLCLAVALFQRREVG